jgi:cyanophycinase
MNSGDEGVAIVSGRGREKLAVKQMIRASVSMAVVLACLAAPTWADEAPKGHLLVIGGGRRPAAILETFRQLAGGASGKVLVLPQASGGLSAGDATKTELEKLGIGTVVILRVDRLGADSEETLRETEGATGVYLGGGDQKRLMATIGGTRLERRLRELYDAGAVIAGTSAGAAVMSAVMITGTEVRPHSTDEAWQTVESQNVVTDTGLGFLNEAIVDQHFVRRKRHNRLLSVMLEQPGLVGIAIDEATAVWVKPDRTFEVVGDGPVMVYDAARGAVVRDATGYGLRASDVRLHVLRAGAVFDLRSRMVLQLAQ